MISELHQEPTHTRGASLETDAAWHEARAAAAEADVTIQILSKPEEATDAAALLDEVWNRGEPGAAPVEPGLLIALAHAGNYVSGAYRGEELLGVAVSFFGTPAAAMMHSHIAGVRSAAKGRGIGSALKLHQRAWCLEQGVTTLEWTFDPLILRNAGFNLNRLGAQLEEYLPQFYGEMRDSTNAGQESDRALIRWHLTRPASPAKTLLDPEVDLPCLLRPGQQSEPVMDMPAQEAITSELTCVGIRIPEDIEGLRQQRPEHSASWRIALRETMGVLLSAGWRVMGVLENGTYVLRTR